MSGSEFPCHFDPLSSLRELIFHHLEYKSLVTMSTVVDVQGFVDKDGTLLLKEIVILDNARKLAHYIFISPYKWSLLPKVRKKAARLKRKHHKFNWYDGWTLQHSTLPTQPILCRSDLVYVKGFNSLKFPGCRINTHRPVLIERLIGFLLHWQLYSFRTVC